MNRILSTTPFAHARIGTMGALVQRIRYLARMNSDARHLDAMSSDRLEDMGIPSRTADNLRTSGETGPMHRPTLW